MLFLQYSSIQSVFFEKKICSTQISALILHTRFCDHQNNKNMSNTLISKCFTFLLSLSAFQGIGAVTPHEISLPIVELTVDQDSFTLVNTSLSKEVQPLCTLSFSSDWMNFDLPIKMQLAGSGSVTRGLKSYELKSVKDGDEKKIYIPNHFFGTDVEEYKSLKIRSTTPLPHRDFPLYLGLAHNAFMTQFGRHSVSKIDYQETLQVVFFVNGKYHGIYDLTETSNASYLKSKYDLKEKNINLCKMMSGGRTWTYQNERDSAEFHSMFESLLAAQDLSEIETFFDLDNLIDYYLCEIYVQNADWPTNNCIVWRDRKGGGKWRFILNDFDFAGLYVDNANLFYLMKDDSGDTFLKATFQKLSKFSEFKNRMTDRLFVACGTYFNPENVKAVVDSLAGNIRSEIPYQSELYVEVCDSLDDTWHETCFYDHWEEYVQILGNWGAERKVHLYEHIQNYLDNHDEIVPLTISADNEYLFNEEVVKETYDGNYFASKPIRLRDTEGYELSGITRFYLKDGTMEESPFVGLFSIPKETARAEVAVTKTETNGIKDLPVGTQPQREMHFDLLGRPVKHNGKQTEIIVGSHGEKRLKSDK